MATPTYITINTGMRLGGALRQAADGFRRDRDLLAGLRAVAITMINGAPGDPAADYSLFEQQFGLPVGQGFNAWYQIDNLYGKLNTNAQVASVMDSLSQFVNQMG